MFINYKKKNEVNDFLKKINKEYYIYNSNFEKEQYLKTLQRVLYNNSALDEEDIEFKILIGIDDKIPNPKNVLEGVKSAIIKNIPKFQVKNIS